MSDAADMLLSVRGEARQTVPPDSATIAATIAVPRGSKADALREAAAGLESLTADLAGQGSAALDAGTAHAALSPGSGPIFTYCAGLRR